MPMVFAVFVLQFEAAFVADVQYRAQQSLVNVAKLSDFERAVVNRFVSGDLLLPDGTARGRLRKNKLAQDSGESLVADTPFFN